jgi:hypothetical protein
MANTIELELITPELPEGSDLNAPRPLAVKRISAEQLQALISLLSSSDPAVVQLPEGKTFADVKRFVVNVLPNGQGAVRVLFN